jgi:hypothetical protein
MAKFKITFRRAKSILTEIYDQYDGLEFASPTRLMRRQRNENEEKISRPRAVRKSKWKDIRKP